MTRGENTLQDVADKIVTSIVIHFFFTNLERFVECDAVAFSVYIQQSSIAFNDDAVFCGRLFTAAAARCYMKLTPNTT